MLRTYAAPPWVIGSVFPKLGFVQKGELPGHLEGVLRFRGCAARRGEYGFMSDKHGFQNLPPLNPRGRYTLGMETMLI